MFLLYAMDSLGLEKPLAVLRKAAAAHGVLDAPFLAFSLGWSYFRQNDRDSALNSAVRSSGRNLSIVSRSKPGLFDFCPQIAAVGLQEAHH